MDVDKNQTVALQQVIVESKVKRNPWHAELISEDPIWPKIPFISK